MSLKVAIESSLNENPMDVYDFVLGPNYSSDRCLRIFLVLEVKGDIYEVI